MKGTILVWQLYQLWNRKFIHCETDLRMCLCMLYLVCVCISFGFNLVFCFFFFFTQNMIIDVSNIRIWNEMRCGPFFMLLNIIAGFGWLRIYTKRTYTHTRTHTYTHTQTDTYIGTSHRNGIHAYIRGSGSNTTSRINESPFCSIQFYRQNHIHGIVDCDVVIANRFHRICMYLCARVYVR